jgi:hypothetical protein
LTTAWILSTKERCFGVFVRGGASALLIGAVSSSSGMLDPKKLIFENVAGLRLLLSGGGAPSKDKRLLALL